MKSSIDSTGQVEGCGGEPLFFAACKAHKREIPYVCHPHPQSHHYLLPLQQCLTFGAEESEVLRMVDYSGIDRDLAKKPKNSYSSEKHW